VDATSSGLTSTGPGPVGRAADPGPPGDEAVDAAVSSAVTSPAGGAVVGALWLSAMRCVGAYLVIPLLGPLLGAAAVLALPVVLGLHVLGVGASTRATWRSWRSGRSALALLAALLLNLNLLGVAALLS
jgi:hypothetical protein